MTPSLKRKLTIGAVSATLLGVAGGGAYAAAAGSSSSTTTDPAQAFLNDVANRLHVSVADLQAALKGAASDQVDQLVKDGKLTQAQADKIKQRIQQGKGPLAGGPLVGPGRFFLGPLGGMDRGGPFLIKPFFGGLDAAAKYLGLTDAQLGQKLASGKSLADIAKAQNKSVDGLKTAIKDQLKSRLDKAVSAKKITQAQENKVLANIDSRLDRLVNGSALIAPRKFFRPKAGLRHAPFFGFPVPAKPGG
jgi:hypothetical protein